MTSSEKVFRSRPGAVLRFSGDDHASFLQGQGTADLRGPVGMCRYCLWLDHRGLIHADAFVLKESESAMLLISYASPVADLLARFERHIIADDVEIEDLTPVFGLISIPPATAAELAATLGCPLPEGDSFTWIESAYCFIGRRLGPGTVEVLVPDAMPDPLASAASMSLDSAETMRVEVGLPLIPQDCPAGTLNPVEANILSAVSFSKGCYLGQEVVSRVQRLQRASKRLVGFSGAFNAPHALPELQIGGQPVGAMTSVVKKPDTLSGLGWLKSRIEDGIHDFDGLRLQVRSLPSS